MYNILHFASQNFILTNAERTEGKWVRYNENGAMVKGEDCSNGNWYRFDYVTGEMIKGWQDTDAGTYFFDYTYGTMAKGTVEIEDETYTFDEITGILLD